MLNSGEKMKVLVILIISFSITISVMIMSMEKRSSQQPDSGNISLAIKTNEKIASNSTKEYWYGKFVKYYFDRGELNSAIKYNEKLSSISTRILVWKIYKILF